MSDISIEIVDSSSINVEIQNQRGQVGFTGSQGVQGDPGQFNVVYINTTYQARFDDAIFADTSTGAFTITLPSNPILGDKIIFLDTENWATNNLTIDPGTETIEGESDTFILDISNLKVQCSFDGTTWRVYTSVGARGYVGSRGYTGSSGSVGFVGSKGANGTLITVSASAPMSPSVNDIWVDIS